MAGSQEKKRILITGASGLLGRRVRQDFSEEGWEVIGLYSSRHAENLVQCDLTAEGSCAEIIQRFRPAVVLHLAAERRPDVVQRDPEKAVRLNVQASVDLAKACATLGAWFIFVSTDYVFDGTSPPYKVTDAPNPLNVYGHHKAEAERRVADECPGAAILRVPLLYGPVEFLAESSVTELFKKLIEGGLSKADALQRRYPTSVSNVALVLREMCDLRLEGRELSGIFHWQDQECFTKHEMALAMCSIAGLDGSKIAGDTVKPPAPRPEDSRLECSRLEQELGGDAARFRMRTFAEEIRTVLRPWVELHLHRSIL